MGGGFVVGAVAEPESGQGCPARLREAPHRCGEPGARRQILTRIRHAPALKGVRSYWRTDLMDDAEAEEWKALWMKVDELRRK